MTGAGDARAASSNGIETTDLLVPVEDAPPVPVRLHRPAAASPEAGLPVLITFFGGAFSRGSIDDEQNVLLAERRCRAAGVIVAAVEYALAPRHLCPTPVLQGLAVLDYLRRHAAALGIDPARVVLGGQSAGADIAAAIALEDAARRGRTDGEQAAVCRLVLEAPVLDLSAQTVDARIPNDMGLDAAGYLDYRRQVRETYQGPGADPLDPLASPLRHPGIASAPPTLLLAAQDDPLRADAEAFHDALQLAGVPVVMLVVRGLTHDGFRAVGTDPAARRWHEVVEGELSRIAAGLSAM